MDKCQSPIEQLIAIELQHFAVYRMDLVAKTKFLYEAQKEISCKNKKYRVDFLVTATNKIDYKIIIECDGHDFHEKTKEQAAKDKKRERFLTSAGYTVFRFTGSEIWKDPLGCLMEVLKYIYPESEASASGE